MNVSKPNTKDAAGVLRAPDSLVKTATPVVGNFSQAIDKPGPNNDLTDAIRALPELAQVLSTASPNGVTALKESVPITAPFGPYSPDLVGFVRDFGEGSGYYDANGHYARVAAAVQRLLARREQHAHPGHPAAGAGRPEDRPAAPLPGRGDAAGGRRLLAVHRQRAA